MNNPLKIKLEYPFCNLKMALATAAQAYPFLCATTILGALSRDISPNNHGAPLHLRSSLVGRRHLGSCKAAKFRTWFGTDFGWRVKCWFKFGKSGVDAEGAGFYGSQKRDDFDRDDVEQYFNYMGMLAVEGSYDKMEALLNKNIHPIDILLLLAASEGDRPKIEELLCAGADYTVTDAEGRTALDRAVDDDIRNLISNFPK